jgi:hypothetical protein
MGIFGNIAFAGALLAIVWATEHTVSNAASRSAHYTSKSLADNKKEDLRHQERAFSARHWPRGTRL